MRWDCLARPLGRIWQMSAACCLPLASLWRRRATNRALERLHVWGSWGCIMSGGDISWVSLCVPIRPGKTSFVAPLRIRMPWGSLLRVLSPPAPLCACGFADARPHYLTPCVIEWLGCLCLVANFKGGFRAVQLLGPSPQRWGAVAYAAFRETRAILENMFI